MTGTLDDDFLYPLYKSDEQRQRYKLGYVTHKRPSEMNRHERRTMEKFQRSERKASDSGGER